MASFFGAFPPFFISTTSLLAGPALTHAVPNARPGRGAQCRT